MVAIASVDPQLPIRKFLTIGTFDVERWISKAFCKWLSSTILGNPVVHRIDKVTMTHLADDILDNKVLTVAKKRSVFRYMVYNFPCNVELTEREDQGLRLFLKEKTTAAKLKVVTAVHTRDVLGGLTAEDLQ